MRTLGRGRGERGAAVPGRRPERRGLGGVGGLGESALRRGLAGGVARELSGLDLLRQAAPLCRVAVATTITCYIATIGRRL